MPKTDIFKKAADFSSEEDRLATFKNWVFDDSANCSARKMAEAGFIHIGTKEDPDAVRCFFCRKDLDGWEEDDDPWQEHLQHAPDCKFAKLQQSQTSITVKEYIDLRFDYQEAMVNKLCNSERARVEKWLDDLVERVQRHKQ